MPPVTPSTPRPMKLVVVSRAAFATYELPAQGTIILGRSEKSDLRVDDPSITRRHARLHLAGEQIELEDLGSVNGTRVRNKRLEPGRPVSIVRGEPFRLGSVLLVVHPIDEDPPPSSNAVSSEEIATRREAVTGTGGPEHRARTHVIHAPVMRDLFTLVDRIAAGNINVLIAGETGVGKELVAERVHDQSRRRACVFLRFNCAAVAESLLEAELFGYERGAFTGAAHAKPGLLEVANGGTFFLDEVGEMSLALQAKLLRAIESRQVLRVGGLSPRTIDVRFVAATNKNLEAQVRQGAFREDLFFRLNGALVVVPPLRERVSEIPLLVEAFIRATCEDVGRHPVPTLSPEARLMLDGYAWPGNVRELRNFIERAVLVSPGDELLPEHFPVQRMASTLPLHRIGSEASPPSVDREASPQEHGAHSERERVLTVLSQCGGNQSRAAKALGISRTTLVARLNDYGVPRPRKP